MSEPILIAQSDTPQYLLPGMANRHGLVAGATGTGKTVTLQVMAEGFSRIGVPVFAADMKGDLSGISQPGQDNPKIDARISRCSLPTLAFRPARLRSGTFLENKAIRFEPPSPKWVRCCSVVCSI